MGLIFPVRLQSIEDFLVAEHGSRRYLTREEDDVLWRWASIVVSVIADNWPIDTGLSSSSWKWVTFDEIGKGIGFEIINTVPYVQYIHRAGEVIPLWETLIPAVLDVYKLPMLFAMRAAILKTEQGSQPQGLRP